MSDYSQEISFSLTHSLTLFQLHMYIYKIVTSLVHSLEHTSFVPAGQYIKN